MASFSWFLCSAITSGGGVFRPCYVKRSPPYDVFGNLVVASSRPLDCNVVLVHVDEFVRGVVVVELVDGFFGVGPVP